MLQRANRLVLVSVFLAFSLVASLVGLSSSRADTSQPRVVKNPYAGVNWDRVQHFKANLHAHTVYSDGRAEPCELIRNYATAGYQILAITDHDNVHTTRDGERETAPTHETTWPWTKWIDEQPSQVWKRDGVETSAFYPGLGERGMLAIRGNELTCDPHIVSLFNECGFTERHRVPHVERDRERLDCVQNKRGLAYWAHPAHYVPGGSWADRGFPWDEGIKHFGSLIAEYDRLLGIELQWGRQAELEEELLDKLLAAYYRDHDLFIMGSDDTHGTSVSGRATITIVLAEELTGPSVRRAFENGHTFVGSRAETLPVFRRITVDEDAKTIRLEIQNHDGITWIRDGKPHHEGPSIDYSGMKDAMLRFRVKVGEVVFLSQAFYIN
jgi:hypothetical protein